LTRLYYSVDTMATKLEVTNDTGRDTLSGSMYAAVLHDTVTSLAEMTATEIMTSSREEVKKVSSRESGIVSLAVPPSLGACQYRLEREPSGISNAYYGYSAQARTFNITSSASVSSSAGVGLADDGDGFIGEALSLPTINKTAVQLAGDETDYIEVFDTALALSKATGVGSHTIPDFCFKIRVNAQIKMLSTNAAPAGNLENFKITIIGYGSDGSEVVSRRTICSGGANFMDETHNETTASFSGFGSFTSTSSVHRVKVFISGHVSAAVGETANSVTMVGGAVSIDFIVNNADVPTTPFNVILVEGLTGADNILNISASGLFCASPTAENSALVRGHDAHLNSQNVMDKTLIEGYLSTLAMQVPSVFSKAEYMEFLDNMYEAIDDDEFKFDAAFKRFKKIGKRIRGFGKRVAPLDKIKKADAVMQKLEPALRIAGMAGVPGAAQAAEGYSQLRQTVSDTKDTYNLVRDVANNEFGASSDVYYGRGRKDLPRRTPPRMYSRGM